MMARSKARKTIQKKKVLKLFTLFGAQYICSTFIKYKLKTKIK